MCKAYSKKDSSIRVIANVHQGLVAAGKAGVRNAKGEYCIFVDSDDRVSEDLISEIIPLTGGGTTDIVNYGLRSVDGEITTDWSYTVLDVYFGRTDRESPKVI